MNPKDIEERFLKEFHPFIAYKVGGISVQSDAKSDIQIAEQLEHCEKEIVKWWLKELSTALSKQREETLKDLWLEEFVNDKKLCCLCRNRGMLVDMDGIRRNCICPNGRSLTSKQ